MNNYYDNYYNQRNNNATKVLPWLWLGGEYDVDKPLQVVDIWIDFRDNWNMNRSVNIPENVMYIKMPFKDGDGFACEKTLPYAKIILNKAKKDNKKVLVSCHAGISRSATMALWCMAEELGFEDAWDKLHSIRPVAINMNFNNLVFKIRKATTKREFVCDCGKEATCINFEKWCCDVCYIRSKEFLNLSMKFIKRGMIPAYDK